MPKTLTDDRLDQLKGWLNEQQVNVAKLNREFSDAVPVANLLKKFHPKLIDLHNYPPRNSTQLKLNNWETLNHKVLDKLGLHQSKAMLEKLAKGIPGAIETLLYDIMLMEQANHNKRDKANDDEQEHIWSENDDIKIVTVNRKVGDAIVQVPQKMILYSIYEQTLRDSQSKDAYLSAAQQKITHLENVLQLKAERIEELCAQLAKISVRSLLKQHNLDNSSSNSTLHLDNIEPSSTQSCRTINT